MDNKLWKNVEGYADPTACAGLRSIIREDAERQKRVNALLYVLKYIVNVAGFDLLNRIELRDRKSGREFR